jgi:alpha-L-fucosidase
MAKRVKELQDLKWGMFICWSFSTFSGKEWTPGITDLGFFKPTGCDTDQWARIARDAGMGYILFLTKHHDGFCLWDTATTDRKVTKSPLGKDVLAAVRKSCDKYGIKLALYFSEGDWNWPGALDGKGGGGGSNPEMKKAQLKELCTQYGPIEFFWMDHAVGDGGLSHAETVAWVKQFQPGCFVGFNHGEPGDLRAGEMKRPGPVGPPCLIGEFTYPIQPRCPKGAMWFYSVPENENVCLPAERLYKDYAGAVKHGNIFSLDVGPDYAGRLRKIDEETLRKVGEMIRNPPPPAPPAPPSVAEGKKATASSTWGAGYEADKAFDGDEDTRWGAAPGSRSGWLEVDLGQETTFNRAVIDEHQFERTQEFVIEYKDGDSWKPIARGTRIGEHLELKFAPVKARVVRLSILKATEVPTIWEFQLFNDAAPAKP